jgi:hypothetical protein
MTDDDRKPGAVANLLEDLLAEVERSGRGLTSSARTGDPPGGTGMRPPPPWLAVVAKRDPFVRDVVEKSDTGPKKSRRQNRTCTY